jgi:hypothetical protein
MMPGHLDALYRGHAPAITASLARVFGARWLDLIARVVAIYWQLTSTRRTGAGA